MLVLQINYLLLRVCYREWVWLVIKRLQIMKLISLLQKVLLQLVTIAQIILLRVAVAIVNLQIMMFNLVIVAIDHRIENLLLVCFRRVLLQLLDFEKFVRIGQVILMKVD